MQQRPFGMFLKTAILPQFYAIYRDLPQFFRGEGTAIPPAPQNTAVNAHPPICWMAIGRGGGANRQSTAMTLHA